MLAWPGPWRQFRRAMAGGLLRAPVISTISQCMSDLLIRDFDPELKRLLSERAQASGRSMSAEAQALLKTVLAPKPEYGLGSELVALFRDVAGDDLVFEYDELPGEPPDFE